MLTKETVIDKIEILELGHIQVRRATYFLEDGVRASGPSYHRVSYSPGDDLSAEHERVQAHSEVAWTEEVVAAHQERVKVAEAAAAARAAQ